MKNNILKFNNCFGCGVCAASCAKKIIKIHLNEEGFYAPYIDDINKCTECGICLDVCAFNHKNISLKPEEALVKSWAAWSNDNSIRRKCSSGGIGFEIGKQLIEHGYHAVGCRYDVNNQIAEHYIASSVDEFVQSIGSKYIQSYTADAFMKIKRKGQKYLVTGTPCQIDSFRRMVRKFHCEDNFVLLDFFCHCVPSMHAWKSYMKMLEPKIGKITYASWRNKFEYGWHDSWLMGIDGDKTSKPIDWHDSYNMLIREKKTYIQSRWSQGDIFYRLFLGDVCHGPQCEYHCKYKNLNSAADIRIGDLWGTTYKNNDKGVSALITFTDKGKSIVDSLTNVTLIEHPINIVNEGQMKDNVHSKLLSRQIRYYLRTGYSLGSVAFKLLFFSYRVVNKINSLLKIK